MVGTETNRRLDVLHKTLVELQDNMRLYLASWQTMCQASAAIAEGLSKLARGDGDCSDITSGVDGGLGERASPLMDMVRFEKNDGKPIPTGIDKERCFVAKGQ